MLHALRAMFRDTVKARWLGADGDLPPAHRARGRAPFRVQEALQEEARRTAAMARERAGVTFKPKSGRPLEGA